MLEVTLAKLIRRMRYSWKALYCLTALHLITCLIAHVYWSHPFTIHNHVTFKFLSSSTMPPNGYIRPSEANGSTEYFSLSTRHNIGCSE